MQGLVAARADVTRLRLGLEGGYAFALEGGGTLLPTFEFGLRHDGGDAETGYGIDIGDGVKWNDPPLGLSAEVSGRGLIAHGAARLKDRGVSGSLAWDGCESRMAVMSAAWFVEFRQRLPWLLHVD